MHFKTFYRMNLFQSSMAMTSRCQKSICIHQDCRNERFMSASKEVWDRVSSPENQFFNISSCNGVCFLPEKFHSVLMRYWWVITYLFFHPISMSSTWRHKIYWFWLISTAFSGIFWSETTHVKTFIALELEEILRNGKRLSSWFVLLFQIRQ